MDEIEAAASQSSIDGQWNKAEKDSEKVRAPSRVRKPGWIRGSRRFSLWLLVLFCVVACLLLGAIIHFILELETERAGTSLLQNAQTMTAPGIRQNEGERPGPKVVDTFRNRLFILMGLTIVCFGTLIYLFVTRLLVPLNVVYSAARDIADGNLSVNVPYRSKHDTADLGRSLNDIASNFQEVLLVTGTKVGACRSAVKTIEEILTHSEESALDDRLKEQVRVVRQELDALGALLESFEFYGTRFDGEKVVWHGQKDPE